MKDRRSWKLDELGVVSRGKSRHRPRNDVSLYGGKYPFFQTGDVKAAGLYLKAYSQTYNEKGLAQSRLWNSGTLCITIAANIAETSILATEGCFPDSVVGFIPNEDLCDVRYIKYYIDTIKLSMQNISRGTTQDNLSLDKLLTFDFRLPPLPIQRRIASILSAYDDLIENNTRRIAILEEMAQAIYREWFVHFRYPGHEDVPLVDSPLGPIPEGWEVGCIGDVVETLGGGTPSTKEPAYWDDGDVIWYSPTDLTSAGTMFIHDSAKHITAFGLQKCAARMFPPYSVMMTSRATIGVVAINTQPASTNQGFITCVPNERLSAWEIYYWLLESKAMIENLASGATFKEINRGTFRKLPVLLPDKMTRGLFASIVDPLARQIEVLEGMIRNLRATRDLLLPRLISGQIDVSADLSVEEMEAHLVS